MILITISCLKFRCLSEAASVAGCISAYDNKCTCPSPAFKDTLTICLKDACTPEDAQGKSKFFEVLLYPSLVGSWTNCAPQSLENYMWNDVEHPRLNCSSRCLYLVEVLVLLNFHCNNREIIRNLSFIEFHISFKFQSFQLELE